jgi:HlyD family secretion protein
LRKGNDDLILWLTDYTLKVPLIALFRCGQQWCVFSEKAWKVAQRKVEIGQRSDRAAQVKQSLHKGEPVILHPTEQIKERIRVKSR